MPILLYRIDDRLIHGQVVVGWGSRLDPDRYLVVDDDLAEAGWEQELYALSVPDDVETEFTKVDEARDRIETWRESALRSILLTRNVDHMLRLARGGRLSGEEVNLGGIHHEPGRTKTLSYLYLDADDRERLQELEAEGLRVEARDLPGSSSVELERLLS